MRVIVDIHKDADPRPLDSFNGDATYVMFQLEKVFPEGELLDSIDDALLTLEGELPKFKIHVESEPYTAIITKT